MIKRHNVLVRMVVLLAAVLLFLAPAASVRAGSGGNEDIGGSVFSVRHFYFSGRFINTPSSSGPDIAAVKNAGPSVMKLGVHDCAGNLLGVGTVLASSYYVGLIGDYSTYSGEEFCMFTEPGSTGSTGTFSANLDWD
jgi:hypothetical protein